MSHEKIELVQQPTDHTCVAACLSMITGIPVNLVIEEVGEKSGLREEQLFLLRSGFGSEITFNIDTPNLFIATVVSINIHGLHAVLIDNRDWDYTVYDPNQGRQDKKIITLENMVWAYLNRVY